MGPLLLQVKLTPRTQENASITGDMLLKDQYHFPNTSFRHFVYRLYIWVMIWYRKTLRYMLFRIHVVRLIGSTGFC